MLFTLITITGILSGENPEFVTCDFEGDSPVSDNKMVIPGPTGDGGESLQVDQNGEKEDENVFDWDFVLNLREMVAELASNDSIVDLSYEIFDHAPAVTINSIEGGLGNKIPKRIKMFYEMTDGFELSWDYLEDGQKRPGGRCHLFAFTKVFDLWLDELWTLPVPEDVDEDFLWSLRGFDRQAPGARDWIVMCAEEEYPTYDLFLYDEKETSFHLLQLSFQDYFKHLLETRGFWGWQYLFAEDTLEIDERRQRRIDAFFERMEKLFRDVDLAPYEARR